VSVNLIFQIVMEVSVDIKTMILSVFQKKTQDMLFNLITCIYIAFSLIKKNYEDELCDLKESFFLRNKSHGER